MNKMMNQTKQQVIKQALTGAKEALKHRHGECHELHEKVLIAQAELKDAQKKASRIEKRIKQLSD